MQLPIEVTEKGARKLLTVPGNFVMYFVSRPLFTVLIIIS